MVDLPSTKSQIRLKKTRKPLQEVIEIQDEVKIKIGKGLQEVSEIDDEE